jgi:hypothetical protein
MMALARLKSCPRTFESDRAEVMRKLGARDTAELVRAALLYPEAWLADREKEPFLRLHPRRCNSAACAQK